MRFVSYRRAGALGTGVLEGDSLAVLGAPTIRELLVRRPDGKTLIEHADSLRTGEVVASDGVTLLSPAPNPGRNIFAVGWNYTDHFEEGARARSAEVALPEHPTFFTKAPQSIVGPDDPIMIDSEITSSWDYEAEIAIVLGSGGRGIPRESAEAAIAGFALANDVTARAMQRRHGGQWFKGKSIDRSCPIGPVLVTPDELPGGRPGRFGLSVNGRLLQSASVDDMYFDFAQIIAELSIGMTLYPGDVILTGTPSGVGYVRTPAVWLADGDEVVVSSPELGELRNRVVDLARVTV
ncbi:fumarylacetoacetate hydrolase family protein [Compostimonas suwonensis]|uniref:2-keto-4-pentenoate hydratase/2-oxohepta-3-ene-1,7-dioic acid hydratase in catechol pathway n=1 Tax=Compostimonas suwonensis TaxID=1048394 RepID=A0A2M9C497_9MICO|nr:fumarylacetoacetate hydrolase family protein [Compostimonas suwonensis]PJJ65360.1 2-keto-4-pentenoate hydratase/2-oxohepta-3-ene-1,7-dioic acid hydratase in catechol pathway [Compostimonas suwonensis]